MVERNPRNELRGSVMVAYAGTEDSKITFSGYIREPEHRGLDKEIVIDIDNPDYQRYVRWFVKITELDERL
jgi:hypothetical protein